MFQKATRGHFATRAQAAASYNAILGLPTLGRPGMGKGVREVVGGTVTQARALFDKLRGSNPVVQHPNGAFVADYVPARHSRNQSCTAEECRKSGIIFIPSCIPQRICAHVAQDCRRQGLGGGVSVTFRATSKSGPATVDVHGIVQGLRKIKFLGP